MDRAIGAAKTTTARDYAESVKACAYCGTTTGPIVLDHIIPQSPGGAGTPNNLAPACTPCNSREAAPLGWVTLDGRS